MQFQRDKALAGEQQEEASPAADHEARACIHARDMLQDHQTTTKLEPTSPAEEASWFFVHAFPRCPLPDPARSAHGAGLAHPRPGGRLRLTAVVRLGSGRGGLP